MLVEGLQTYLAADAAMQVQLGTPSSRKDKSTGIFPVQAPDEVPAPWVVMTQVSGNPLQTSTQGTGRLQTNRWRFTCYGSTYKQAKTLARKLFLAMKDMSGDIAGASVRIEGCWLQLEMDEAEPLPRGTVFASHQDFVINYLDTEGL
jgi:hypothetical protein